MMRATRKSVGKGVGSEVLCECQMDNFEGPLFIMDGVLPFTITSVHYTAAPPPPFIGS